MSPQPAHFASLACRGVFRVPGLHPGLGAGLAATAPTASSGKLSGLRYGTGHFLAPVGDPRSAGSPPSRCGSQATRCGSPAPEAARSAAEAPLHHQSKHRSSQGRRAVAAWGVPEAVTASRRRLSASQPRSPPSHLYCWRPGLAPSTRLGTATARSTSFDAMAAATDGELEARWPRWPDGEEGLVALDVVLGLPVDQAFLLLYGGLTDMRVRRGNVGGH